MSAQLPLVFAAIVHPGAPVPPQPRDLYAPRSVPPTRAEVAAHAKAHPIAPGSDCGWWSLTLVHGGQARTGPVAMRVVGAWVERYADGEWRCFDADAAGLIVGGSIAPLTTTGDPAQWPTSKREMMRGRMPRPRPPERGVCFALLEFAHHAVGAGSPAWGAVADLVLRAAPPEESRLARLAAAAQEVASLAHAAAMSNAVVTRLADVDGLSLREVAERCDCAALRVHDRVIAERRAVPDDLWRDERRAAVDATYEPEIAALHSASRRLRAAVGARECADGASEAIGPVRPPLAYDAEKLWREVGLRAGDAFASALDACATGAEREAWVSLLRATLERETEAAALTAARAVEAGE